MTHEIGDTSFLWESLYEQVLPEARWAVKVRLDGEDFVDIPSGGVGYPSTPGEVHVWGNDQTKDTGTPHAEVQILYPGQDEKYYKLQQLPPGHYSSEYVSQLYGGNFDITIDVT